MSAGALVTMVASRQYDTNWHDKHYCFMLCFTYKDSHVNHIHYVFVSLDCRVMSVFDRSSGIAFVERKILKDLVDL